MNNKGYMLIEVIVSFAIAFLVIMFLSKITVDVKNKSVDFEQFNSYNYTRDLIIKDVMDDVNSMKVTGIVLENSSNCEDGSLCYIKVKIDYESVSKYLEISIIDDDKKVVYDGVIYYFDESLVLSNLSFFIDDVSIISVSAFNMYSSIDYGVKFVISVDTI